MTSLNQASDRTKQTDEQQYTEEQYRTIQKQTPRLRKNTPPVCRNKQSYELTHDEQQQTPGKCFTNAKFAVK